MSCLARSGRKLKKIAASPGPSLGPGQNDRLDELVRDAGLVARLDRGHSVLRRSPRAVHDGTQRAVGAVPALVAVHRVVAPADRDDARCPR